MATCKECLHYRVCADFGLILDPLHDGVICEDYKHKEDVVEVVRCSECQHWGGVTFGFICRKFSGESTKICMHAEDYCSYGERRSE